jgi:peptide-methionine (S)-S-oxide reductase
MESTTPHSITTQTATLAGGCFWCLEAVFDAVQGIDRVTSGYMGGDRPHPTYEEVCTGATGHAEVVQIEFLPGTISYDEILAIFFVIHDPTTLNRQGNDVGTQYRSAIFYHTEQQKIAAEQFIGKLERGGIWGAPIVTELVPASAFYPAEDYHQRYFARNANQPYCRAIVAPKVAKLRSHFLSKLKKPATADTR